MELSRIKELSIIATKARIEGLTAVYGCKSGHIGGSLSSMDILTALYFNTMNVDSANPHWEDRDRFVLSKGHCTPGLYSVLALKGFFPVEDLALFRSIDGYVSGHAEMRHMKGVDMSTGSLGQGLSAASGMALAAKMDNKSNRVFALMGDGELAEGQIWEAAMAAAKYKLDNLCGIVDVNGLQIDGKTADVMPSDPLDKKWEAFGWHVVKCDGHDFAALDNAFAEAAATKGKPTVILANTVKGKGVSYMENNYEWHGKAPNQEQFELGKSELLNLLKELEG